MAKAKPKTKVSPFVKAMAEWVADDTLDEFDAGVDFRPERKRLGREGYKKLLDKEAPAKMKPKKGAAKTKATATKRKR